MFRSKETKTKTHTAIRGNKKTVTLTTETYVDGELVQVETKVSESIVQQGSSASRSQKPKIPSSRLMDFHHKQTKNIMQDIKNGENGLQRGDALFDPSTAALSKAHLSSAPKIRTKRSTAAAVSRTSRNPVSSSTTKRAKPSRLSTSNMKPRRAFAPSSSKSAPTPLSSLLVQLKDFNLSEKPWWYKEMCMGNPSLKYPVMTVDPTFKSDALKWHNYYRRKHDVPDLTWSNEAYNCASRWAQYLCKDKGALAHSAQKYRYGFGENLAWKSFSSTRPVGDFEYKPQEAIEAWYSEIEDYDFSTHQSRNGKAVGHFTQVVWKETRQMGMACAIQKTSKNGMNTVNVFVVANYLSPGNVLGKYEENVPKPIA